MAKRGKKKFLTPRESVEIQLPQPLYIKVELLLLDPVSEKRRYGAISKLCTELLDNWVKKQIGENKNA